MMTTLAACAHVTPARRPCRLSPQALGRLSDGELAFLADCSLTPTTRAAALLVLVGRATAADALAAMTTTAQETAHA